ncbi:hypothetical protein AZ66_06470 [Paenibacillus sp. E194]|uniref:hypothetical protein n=1 Tax=Paenibacillus sp. E194 TaxID=1458845 RepID=UPI0005C9C5FB|nr:hypothetical protein [Paenibacillus sp. E194]KJB88591.1 hypothetical protein AZ66_06470 [Paenibacillus sp. E194]
MNLKVYQIIKPPTKKEKWKELVEYLSQTGFYAGEHGLRYCLNSEYQYDEEQGIYVGAIHEEYIPDQTSVDGNKQEQPIVNIDPWERTIFAIDFVNEKLLIQLRDYSPRNLSRKIILARITGILSDAWEDLFNSEYNYIPTNLSLGNDYFINSFINKTRVTGVKLSFDKSWIVTDIYDGKSMPENWKAVWNEDQSDLSDLTLKTSNDGDLHESPLFKIALSSPGVTIESVSYFDSAIDKIRTESRTQFDQIDVTDVNKRTELPTALYETVRTMVENRKKLQQLKAINLV